MKKLLWMLGLGIALVGCDDGAKPTANADKAEKTTVVSDVKEMEKVAKDTTEVEKAVNEPKEVADKTVNSEEKSAVKSKDVSEEQAQKQFEKRPVKQTTRQAQVQQTRKSVQRHLPQNDGIGSDGLSAEERRVSQQAKYASSTGKANKAACRYPNLSAEERRVNHCY